MYIVSDYISFFVCSNTERHIFLAWTATYICMLGCEISSYKFEIVSLPVRSTNSLYAALRSHAIVNFFQCVQCFELDAHNDKTVFALRSYQQVCNDKMICSLQFHLSLTLLNCVLSKGLEVRTFILAICKLCPLRKISSLQLRNFVMLWPFSITNHCLLFHNLVMAVVLPTAWLIF